MQKPAENSNAKKKPRSRNGFLKLLSLVLLVLIAVFFVKSRIDNEKLQKQLEETKLAIARQEILNTEAELMLQDESEYMERSAREDLDYADPEEQVFVVVP